MERNFGPNIGCPLHVLEPNTGYIFFQNSQQASGIEREQQSENVQEVIENNN